MFTRCGKNRKDMGNGARRERPPAARGKRARAPLPLGFSVSADSEGFSDEPMENRGGTSDSQEKSRSLPTRPEPSVAPLPSTSLRASGMTPNQLPRLLAHR